MMNLTPQQYVHIGFGNVLCANRVEALLGPGSANAKRLQKHAKNQQRYLDMTSGRAVKCLLLLDDGKIVGCALTSRTIVARISSTTAGADSENEGEEIDEDHSPVGQAVDAR